MMMHSNTLRPSRLTSDTARSHHRCGRKNIRRAGMTLIETALAIVIIGTGVLAIISAQVAFHLQNTWSSHAAIAYRLGNEIREMTLNLSRHDPVTWTAYWGPEPHESTLADYNDLDDFDGAVFSAGLGNGPVNARREVIPDMAGWAQIVQVDMINPHNINIAYAIPDDEEDYPEKYLMRVQVIVTYQGPNDASADEVIRVSWLAPN